MAAEYVVSACLAGCSCRYDGGSNACRTVIRLVEQGLAIPVCPEVLGGLPVPRQPSEQRDGKVFSRDGRDVSAAFRRGAEAALQVALEHGCTKAILKARSPSCGVGSIYDGTFGRRLVVGDGWCARALHEAGLQLYTEESLPPVLMADDEDMP